MLMIVEKRPENGFSSSSIAAIDFVWGRFQSLNLDSLHHSCVGAAKVTWVATVQVSGDWCGGLSIRCSQAVAEALAACCDGLPDSDGDDLIEYALGEVIVSAARSMALSEREYVTAGWPHISRVSCAPEPGCLRETAKIRYFNQAELLTLMIWEAGATANIETSL